MASTILQGLVINKKDFQEKDLIVEILTEQEYLTFIALGTRKLSSKNRFSLEIGNIIEVEIFKARLNNKMSKLKKATLVLQVPLEKENIAKIVFDLVKKINQSNKSFSPLLFKSINESFKYLDTQVYLQVKTYVLFNFLACLGIYPSQNGCLVCKSAKRINGFSFEQGGFSCFYHTKNKRSLEELKAIYSLFQSFEKYKDTSSLINKKLYLEIEKVINKQLT